MKKAHIKSVKADNRKQCFTIDSSKGSFHLPYVKIAMKPTSRDRIVEVYVDKELDNCCITYVLESGKSNSVHLDAFLDYNKDTEFLQELIKYKMTVMAINIIEHIGFSKAELVRRLETSPAQVARLLDTANYSKSIDQMVKLLAVLGCHVMFEFDFPGWPKKQVEKVMKKV